MVLDPVHSHHTSAVAFQFADNKGKAAAAKGAEKKDTLETVKEDAPKAEGQGWLSCIYGWTVGLVVSAFAKLISCITFGKFCSEAKLDPKAEAVAAKEAIEAHNKAEKKEAKEKVFDDFFAGRAASFKALSVAKDLDAYKEGDLKTVAEANQKESLAQREKELNEAFDKKFEAKDLGLIQQYQSHFDAEVKKAEAEAKKAEEKK